MGQQSGYRLDSRRSSTDGPEGNTQDGSGDFSCRFCNKRLSTKNGLRLHEHWHTGENLFKCQFCEKIMTTKNGLEIHERRHTGERPFVCDVCQKGFCSKGQLKSHYIVHMNIWWWSVFANNDKLDSGCECSKTMEWPIYCFLSSNLPMCEGFLHREVVNRIVQLAVVLPCK